MKLKEYEPKTEINKLDRMDLGCTIVTLLIMAFWGGWFIVNVMQNNFLAFPDLLVLGFTVYIYHKYLIERGIV
jgi:accessory gene regulator protein AgrB